MRGKPQLPQRAEHAVARHAAQLALFDLLAAVHCGMIQRDGDKIALLQILRAGNDLEGFPLPRVDLADPEVVGIRVLFERQQFADHDIGQIRPFFFIPLHLGAGEGHFIAEGFIVNI